MAKATLFFLQHGEMLLDFAVEREAPRLRFRENQFALSDDIELPTLAGRDVHILAELRFQ